MKAKRSADWDSQKDRLATLFRRVGRIPGLGDCGKIEILDSIHVSVDARLFLARLPGRADSILIKCCHKRGSDAPDVAAARKQFEELVELNRLRKAGARFNLVQPFHLFEEEGVIVQSWIDGRSLDKILGDARAPAGQVEGLVRAAGEWIGHFHNAGGIVPNLTDLSELPGELAAGGADLGRRGRRIIGAAEALHSVDARRNRSPLPTALLHCDYKPANLIVSDQGVFGIDFQLSQRASVYFDLAHFLNSAAIDALKLRRPSLLLHATALEDAFVDGYSKVAVSVEPIMLRFFQVYDLARYMLHHGNARDQGLRAAAKWRGMEMLLSWRVARLRSHVQTAAR